MAESPSESDQSGSRETRASLLSGMRRSKDDARRRESQTAFFQTYRPRLFAYFRARGLTIHDAEDLAADLVLKLMKAMESFAYDPGQRFRAYLSASARHALQAFWNQRKQRRISERDGSLLEQLVELDDLEKRINDQFDVDLLEEAKKRVQSQVSDRDWAIYVGLTDTPMTPEVDPISWTARDVKLIECL